jgi:SAM-dependent methyltransferase
LINIIRIIRESTFKAGVVQVTISKVLSVDPIGRLIFNVSILAKRLSLTAGFFSQRAAEYPWLLTKLGIIKPSSLILDVGCAESLLGHQLVSKGFKVVGLDIRDCPFKNKRTLFVKRNVMDTQLPDTVFDAAIMVSTVEHIGINVYGQLTLEDDGDLKTVGELHRILKPQGILILTTPFVGGNLFKTLPFERQYNRERLTLLLKDFEVLEEDYFFPNQYRQRIYWIKMNKNKIDRQNFKAPGIACLVLKKH